MILQFPKKIFPILSKKRLLIIVILLVFFIITSKAYINHIFFLDFADEEENFLVGKLLLNGKKLYSDIFTQHQPINFFLSALIQKIINPQTISAVVKTHRLIIILWSVIWGVILTLRFGLPLFFTVIVIELAKISLLGNLFLAETLVVYPLLYICSYAAFVKNDHWPEFIAVCLLIIFIFFNLLPLWPLIIFLSLYLMFRNNKRLTKGGIFLGLFFLLSLIIFRFSSIKDYFYDTLYLTIRYYSPLSKEFAFTQDLGGTFAPFKGLIAPIIALLDANKTYLLWVIKIISLTLIINLVLLVKYKKKKKAILIIFILALASLRYVPPSAELYGAFHMLPWFSLLTLFASITSLALFKQTKNLLIKSVICFLISSVFITALVQSKYTLFDIRNPQADLHIHYSPQYQYSQALKIMKKPNDTLFVVPANMLLYWDANIPPASKYTYFYSWMEKTTLTGDVKQMFTKNPPTFLYCQNCQKTVVYKYVHHYHQLNKSINPSNLFVRKDKLLQLSQKEKEKLKQLDFNIN